MSALSPNYVQSLAADRKSVSEPVSICCGSCRSGRQFLAQFADHALARALTRACVAFSVAFLLPSSGARAQGIVKYVNRDLQFTINLPHMPVVGSTLYQAADGTHLPAQTFTASQGSAEYRLTVVDFSNHPSAERGATAFAAAEIAARGEADHNRHAYMDGLSGHHLSVMEPDGERRIAAIYLYDHRLYISEGSDDAGAPLTSAFTHSIIITHKDGTQLNLDGYNAESFNAFESAY